MLRLVRRWAAAGALLLGLVAGALGGIYADQVFPEYIPSLGAGQPRGQLDRTAIDQALRIIQANYYDRKLDYQQLSRGSVRGLVQSLGDPYTQYLDPQQYGRQQQNYAGEHAGVIGIYVSFEADYPKVAGIIPGSPAQRAGIHTGDLITSIDGRDAKGMNPDQTAVLIRGPKGTSVQLGLRRDGSDLSVTVERGDFASPMVLSLMIGTTLYVRVYQFGTATADEFDKQLAANLPHARGVVLDLRDDPGGYISAATDVISKFVAGGEAYELRDRNGHVDRTEVQGDHPAAALPLVVLVNGGTASASEIVAGSLQSRHRAQLVGARTFGKGSVQVDFQLRDGGDLHLTVQHWFLPDGRSVDRTGLQPDVRVPLPRPEDMFDVAQPSLGHDRDAQLNRALELLAAR